MKFGLFYEHQLPKPWGADDEYNAFHDALAQIELADQLGYDCVWAVEHHFLEEYAHSSAPEILLAAASQRAKRIRLGHGVMILTPGINHPARCAERLSTLDLISDGRVEWGTGESSSAVELEAFHISIPDKREMWREGVAQCARMMAMEPYPGFEGRFFSMPCRNVIPKPRQKPHPPLWMACNNFEAVQVAAQNGMGALLFQFSSAEKVRPMVEEYYRIIKSDACVPIGYTVNANVCVISALAIHAERAEAIRRGRDNFGFFGRVLKHYYLDGEHQPYFTNMAAIFEQERVNAEERPPLGGVGTPDDVREHVAALEEIGADQVGFVRQFGRATHQEMCDELQLFASEVMRPFQQREAERARRKAAELAPYIEAAMKRKPPEDPVRQEQVSPIMALPQRAVLAQQAGQAKGAWERPDRAHVTDILNSV